MNLMLALTLFFLGLGHMEPITICKDTIAKIRAGCPCQDQPCKKCGKKHPGQPCPQK